MVALYAELDEKADHLRRADEMKSRFLSNMSHEFRTPLNSILALSRLLLDRSDGELTAGAGEAGRASSARRREDLTELVNDLLDLAKVEAGKTVVRAVEFTVADLFGALRGMLRPLLVGDAVALVVRGARRTCRRSYTDEGKVSQILRNFISNALKFTERGEVRVAATAGPEATRSSSRSRDTGIGIAPKTTTSSSSRSSARCAPPAARQGHRPGAAALEEAGRTARRDHRRRERAGQGSTFSVTAAAIVSAMLAEADEAERALGLEPGRVPVLVGGRRSRRHLRATGAS